MIKHKKTFFTLFSFLSLCSLGSATTWAASPQTKEQTEALYLQHCGQCHGLQRLGAMGPALLPENLKRLRKKQALTVISEGRAATQMPAHKDKLNPNQIQALVDYIYTPLGKALPPWNMAEINASHILHNAMDSLANQPVFEVKDLLNLFLVVELADHHVTLLDGDKLEPIHRFKTRFALHGGPKYAADGRFVYFASRDGWISKYDIYNLKLVAEIRAGINTRNLAISADGRYVAVANYLPNTLVLLDAHELKPIKVIDAQDQHGNSSRVSAVYTAKPRQSFIAALKDVAEVWEISYADNPPAGFSGWEPDYHPVSGGGVKPDPFPLRRSPGNARLDDFFFDQDYIQLIGTARETIAESKTKNEIQSKKGKRKKEKLTGQVVDLDLGRALNVVDIPGMPHLSSGITWEYQGKTVMATPNIREGMVSIIDMESWKVIKRIKTQGPGFFMRSHENTPYAWVDVFFGPNKDLVHVIDKRSLEIVKTLRPAPGKTAAHVEFTRDGKYALLSIWDPDGAVVVYDADTLKEVKRLPMKKPSGKYNVYNKTRLSAGTSH